MKKVSIIIPIYNEEKIIENTVMQVDRYLHSYFNDDYEILLSNDGSTDNSAETAVKLQPSYPNLRIVNQPDNLNHGKGAAIRNGMLRADAEYLIFTDCDLAYGLDVFKRITDIFDYSPEIAVIIGSRNITKDGHDGYSSVRKLMSKLYLSFITMFTGLKYSDSQCGIKGFRCESARVIFSQCVIERFAFDLEVLLTADKLKLPVREMDVKIINHNDSASKVKIIKDTLRMIKDVSIIKKRLK